MDWYISVIEDGVDTREVVHEFDKMKKEMRKQEKEFAKQKAEDAEAIKKWK